MMDKGIGSQWLLPVAKVDIGGKILFDSLDLSKEVSTSMFTKAHF